jgi:hypothetical protein
MKDVVVVGSGSRIGRSKFAMLAAALATVGSPVSVEALSGIDQRQRERVERQQAESEEHRQRIEAAEAKRARKAAKLRKLVV